MNIIDRLFNKKSNKLAKELIQPLNFDLPEVIKPSKIKPTKCEFCKTIYQATPAHLKHDCDIGFLHERYNLFVQCPICKNYNTPEFEEDTV